MAAAGMPSQCAWNALLILPWNNQEMECPKPQPGHQVIPRSLSGHNEKWTGPDGSVNASETMAAIQNKSSKYFKKNCLINFI